MTNWLRNRDAGLAAIGRGKPRGMTDDYYAHTRHVGPVSGCPHCPDPFDDPGPDSLFRRTDRETCVCKVCGAVVPNNTEGRDGHLNRTGCHVYS